jgi:hypothetical protein
MELYKQCFTLADFFPKLGIFAGLSLYIINLAVRISAAMMAGDIIFSGCRTVYKGAMDGARGGEYYEIKASLVQWKDIRLWQPEFRPEKKITILFLEISRVFL